MLVDGEDGEGPYYNRRPFAQEPDGAVTRINLEPDRLLARAKPRP